MSYITQGTVWPEFELPRATKALISRFFELADLNAPEAGSLMANEVFALNAVLKSGEKQASGSTEIAGSRKMAWNEIQKRQHHVLRVYTRDLAGKDLVLIGELDTEDKRSVHAHLEFCARCVIDEKSSPHSPRLAFYEVWVVL